MRRALIARGMSLAPLLLAGCLAPTGEGLAPNVASSTKVRFDFFHRPLPELPLPNDVATRYDGSSATHRRINASMLAPTTFEARVRTRLDQLDGWGLFQPIEVSFDGPALDVGSILAAQRDPNYRVDDDIMFVVNIDPASPRLGTVYPLDFGNGNYPMVLKRRDYWDDDPRGNTLTLLLEETQEDTNGNGRLDPGEDLNGNGVLDPGEDLDGDGRLSPPEDTDADGLLDVPNYFPGAQPPIDNLAARTDATMTFYERQTGTLIGRLLEPLDERTRYAVVVTRRLKNVLGESVSSPFDSVNHLEQTEDLERLPGVLPQGTHLQDVAFTWSFTTQTAQSAMIAVRDGLYGHGIQQQLATAAPAELSSIEPMRDRAAYPGITKPHLLYGEDLMKVIPTLLQLELGIDSTSYVYKQIVASLQNIDYVVVGSYQSPQLFDRVDAHGAPLPLDDQSWPADLDRVTAHSRNETVYFTLTVPRKEVSVRGQGKPAPVAFYGHGYGSSRLESLPFAGLFANHGIAVLSIDDPSHGLGITPDQAKLAAGLFGSNGVAAAATALLHDRSFDQNNDGVPDSGADFWTAYMFHTRDMVRQSVLDWMQLVRIVKSFDGVRRWQFDVDGDGTNELAGDFDADGVVDIGADSPLSGAGGSLGGMTTMLLGSLEPYIKTVAPFCAGGGLSDIGIRSIQGGLAEAVLLRAMGPLFTGTLLVPGGAFVVAQIVPDLNHDAVTFPMASVEGVRAGDTFVVENLHNGERGCGFINDAGQVRANVASDLGDAMRISVYPGPQLLPKPGCVIRPDAPAPRALLDHLSADVSFQGITHAAGEPIPALAEGLGNRRAHPDYRRFYGISQMVLDAADPATFARHLSREPLHYPGTNLTTGAHALLVNTIGDMNVPVATAVTYGRAAGFIDYRHDDPRYGKPVDQVLIDQHMIEGVHDLLRYTDPSGGGVLMDVDNLSEDSDFWAGQVPRLDPPLRIGADQVDALGGVSAALFIYSLPTGLHGFEPPGTSFDRQHDACVAACSGPPASCDCDKTTVFDVGSFVVNAVARYFASEGTFLSLDPCHSNATCTAGPYLWGPPPPFRPAADLK